MKIETKTFHVVQYNEFERAVKDHFGVSDYSFVANEELSNDVSKTYTASMDESLDEYEVGQHKEWLSGESVYALYPGALLSMMAQAGKIPAGEYLIEVCW